MGIKSIIGALGLSELTGNRNELIEYIEAETASCLATGDTLGAGEWTANKMFFVTEQDVEQTFTQALCLWSSPDGLRASSRSLTDFVSRIDEFFPEDVAVAAVALVAYLDRSATAVPNQVSKLTYHLEKPIRDLFDLYETRQGELLNAATARFDAAMHDLQVAVRSFVRTNCVTAKRSSVDLVKKERQYRKMVLAAERPMVTALDGLLGTTFRRFCECYEQQNVSGIIGTARDLGDQALKLAAGAGKNQNSTFWNLIILPTSRHVNSLIEEGRRRSAAATTPKVQLAPATLKLDLSRSDHQMQLLCRLNNDGDGRANHVVMKVERTDLADVEIELLEPTGPFDIGSKSEQLVSLGVTVHKPFQAIQIPVIWESQSITGATCRDKDVLRVGQQSLQPNWDRLQQTPPYSLNPIKIKENLYGRSEVLTRLILNATSGTSTFLWGQKRVGKTSVLQVLASELTKLPNFFCVILRMGEITSLHEGQIAHLLAMRLHHHVHRGAELPPDEKYFGAGLGTLIPFVESLQSKHPEQRLVVIIDEFDDLNPAFYIGERGRQFVKALRSLSEIGLTFFFVGSERMNTIYRQHELELNKWTNESLDRIESREDCKALITNPVAGSIEYQRECVDLIVDYCGRNPFYMHQICHKLFARCFSEKSTFISESTLKHVRGVWLQSMGGTNFAHFWEDNPELDEREKMKQAAENCLALCCIALATKPVASSIDLVSQQDVLSLGPSERISDAEARAVIMRLVKREIIETSGVGGPLKVTLPIFGDWLKAHAEMLLLPKWREYARAIRMANLAGQVDSEIAVADQHFPITEEELLSISQSLVYCGRQKDATELRVWLRQFDDDVRIEIAYSLLKRLAEKGFVSDGAMASTLSMAQDSVAARRRLIGSGQWSIFQGKKENLCISYIDSELKSGATTARELKKRLRPGKTGSIVEIIPWMKAHVEKDAMVVLVDDFAGSGKTVADGLRLFKNEIGKDPKLKRYFSDKRVHFVLLYSLPQAIDRIREEHPDVELLSINVFGEEVCALDERSGIFTSVEEARFAQEVVMQIGRELWPAYPRGFNDVGVLISFQNTVPNNTLPIFWKSGVVAGKTWRPLFPRA